ncbi:MAG: M28 family peptidase [Candidatus Eisenbacteria bacterium]|nr:M28 family peptidase [Candidatus Eisenbacteria bacterium]
MIRTPRLALAGLVFAVSVAGAADLPRTPTGTVPSPAPRDTTWWAPGALPGTPRGGVPGAGRIRGGALMRTVTRLARPELKGRLAGSPGYMRAAREMAEALRAAGLKPAGDDGYFQKLNVEYNEVLDAGLELVPRDGPGRALKLGPDFACRGLTGSGDLTAPVVFAGYGVSRPEQGYDDYAGLDAKGKVVLAFKEAPPFRVDSAGWGGSTLPRPKARAAARHGARALLIVPVPGQEHPQKPIASMLEGDGPQDENFPVMQVDESVARELLRAAGLDPADLKARIDSTKSPDSHTLPVSVHVRVKARYHASQASVNVVALLPGADPKLRQEYVVVGAHLDHVGSQGDSLYFPGANDNASGSAAVLELARAFAGTEPCARSIIFALFSSEEAGLYGARRFVERPPVPAERIVAYVNMDCVGHGDSIQVGGGKSYPRLWSVARDLDSASGRRMVEATWAGGGADAAPFEEAHIPNLYFASKFSYTHLHLPTDTPSTLNRPLFEALARLAYGTVWTLAGGGAAR